MIASQYHWTRDFIWKELALSEVMLYVQAIRDRKLAESGGKDEGVPMSIINLLNVVGQVRAERKALTIGDSPPSFLDPQPTDDMELYEELLT